MSQIPFPAPLPNLHDGFVVALHGSAFGPSQWSRWLDLLPASIDFLSPALAGYGKGKGWEVGRSISLSEEAARIEPLLAVAKDGVHLIGHSYGGAVAMEVARLWPDRVRSLTLYEPARFAVLRALDPVHWQGVHRLGRNLELQALACANESAAARFIDFWSGAGSWNAMEPRARSRIANFMPKVQAEFDALFVDSVPLHAWSVLQMPMHLLYGDRSPVAAQSIVKRLAQVVPHARVRVLAGACHMAPVLDPRTVIQAMGMVCEPTARVAA